MALVLITHNMGVVAEMAQRVAVMYAGQVVEERARQRTLFESPQHPYTAALMAAMPERSDGRQRLATIPGVVPGACDRPRAACSRRAAPTPPTFARRAAGAARMAGGWSCRHPLRRRERDATDPAASADGRSRACARDGAPSAPRRGTGDGSSHDSPAVVEARPDAAPTPSGAACFASRRGCRPSAACRSRSRPAARWRWSASRAAASRRWRAW